MYGGSAQASVHVGTAETLGLALGFGTQKEFSANELCRAGVPTLFRPQQLIPKIMIRTIQDPHRK